MTKGFGGLYILFEISRHLILLDVKMASLKKNQLPHHLLVTYLSKAVWLLNAAVPRKESSPLVTLWAMIRTKRVLWSGRPCLKTQDSFMTCWALFFFLITAAHTLLSRLVHPPAGNLAKMGPRRIKLNSGSSTWILLLE